MALVDAFVGRCQNLQRPVFTAIRFGHVGDAPFTATLADVADDGNLRVFVEIRKSEMPAFIAWCRQVYD